MRLRAEWARPIQLKDASKDNMIYGLDLAKISNEAEASAAVQKAQHDRGQADLATLSSNGRQITATSSGHHIHLDEPDLVIEATRQVIHAVRSKTPLCCRRP